jgi:hypothetical protein
VTAVTAHDQVAELQAGLEALRAERAAAERAERAAAAAAAAAARRTCRVCFDDSDGAAGGMECPARGAEHFVCGGCFGPEIREQVPPSPDGAPVRAPQEPVSKAMLS